jgi:hypothetical protein
MPVNASVIPIASASGVVADEFIFRPVRTGERGIGGERTSAGKRAVLNAIHTVDGTAAAYTQMTGTYKVMGADLPNPLTGGGPLGNVFAQAATPTSVRPQGALIPADGTTTAFTTEIDLASGDLAAAIAAGSILCEVPAFKLTGTIVASAAGALTGTGTKFSAGVTSAVFGGELKVGDILNLGGVSGKITAVSSDTAATWDQTTAVASSAGYNVSRDRRFKSVFAASGAATGDPEAVEATVSNSKLVLTFKVAPPALQPLPVSGVVTPGGALAVDPAAAYLVTPVEILAAGVNASVRVGVRSRSVLFAQVKTVFAATENLLVTLEHASE